MDDPMGEYDEAPEDNDAIRAAKRAKASAEAAEAGDKRPLNWKTAAGIGIGSAAVLAALIYANKSRKKED
jgi:hypothetical protein